MAVIGGGPAGSFFSYFLLSLAKQVDLHVDVDIFEPRDFNIPGPQGCNMCGGVLYEALVQNLAVEGINLPPSVVQRGMEYNMLHLDSGTALSHTPRHEKRIAATFRGIGPRGLTEVKGGSLDYYLLQEAIGQGARQIRSRVEAVSWVLPPDTQDLSSNRVKIRTQKEQEQVYDFVAVATGVNTALLKQFEKMDFGDHPPNCAATSKQIKAWVRKSKLEALNLSGLWFIIEAGKLNKFLYQIMPIQNSPTPERSHGP